MKGFEKLLDTVRKSNPDLISEQQAQTMLDDYNSYETQLQNDSYENGKAAGFEEGYREGMEKQKAVCKQEMDDLLAKCDEEATNKVEAIVRMINDDHTEKLNQVYNILMNQMQNMVPVSEVEAMDKDHAEKFQQAIDAINDDHCAKLNNVVNTINEDHAKKFQKAIDTMDAVHTKKLNHACKAVANVLYKSGKAEYDSINNKYTALATESANTITSLRKSLKDEKTRKLSMLTESVEKYLNYALQNAIPSKKLISEAKYNASQKAIEKITSILKINNILQESKDGIFNDYEAKLEESKKAQDALVAENVKLKSKLDKEEAKLLLESKVANCTPSEAAFLRSYFENAKNAAVIEEQIDDARSAFKRIHNEKRNAMIEKMNKNNAASASQVVNESKEKTVKKEEPVRKVVTESKETTKQINAGPGMNPFIMAYAEMLKKDN